MLYRLKLFEKYPLYLKGQGVKHKSINYMTLYNKYILSMKYRITNQVLIIYILYTYCTEYIYFFKLSTEHKQMHIIKLIF